MRKLPDHIYQATHFHMNGGVPKPPKPPAPPTSAEASQALNDDGNVRKRKGFASTVLTGGSAPSQAPNNQQKTVLGQ